MVEWRGKNEARIHRSAKHFSIEGGRNRERKRRIPRIGPPALCTKAKVAKRGGGAYLRDTTVAKPLRSTDLHYFNRALIPGSTVSLKIPSTL